MMLCLIINSNICTIAHPISYLYNPQLMNQLALLKPSTAPPILHQATSELWRRQMWRRWQQTPLISMSQPRTTRASLFLFLPTSTHPPLSLSLPHADTRGVCSAEQECVCVCALWNLRLSLIIGLILLEQTRWRRGEEARQQGRGTRSQSALLMHTLSLTNVCTNSGVGWPPLWGVRQAGLQPEGGLFEQTRHLKKSVITSLFFCLKNHLCLWAKAVT